jgi:cell fate regulator YaaT (PSP1 superfamily)
MVEIVGVGFLKAGKTYYFDPAGQKYELGDMVIVETARGLELGHILIANRMIEEDKLVAALKPVERKATDEDLRKYKENLSKRDGAMKICAEKIAKHGLDMKLIDAEYTFDNSKILFYFTADGRVDFRELVRDLAGVFRTRIELRQIGVRDETKIIGGYGICGRKLCCQAYLSDFVPVSIKMAKEQNLSLNPTKISGACGRLMCCLKYEEETYEELNKNLPRQGDEVRGSDGLVGEVESVNVLRQTVRILVEVDNEKEYHEYGVDDITIVRRRRRGQARQARKEKKENSSREMKELQKLEHEDKKSGKSRLRE